MRKLTCASCSLDAPLNESRLIENKTYCGSCVEKVAASSMQGRGYALVDPTICAQCKTDWGNVELRRVGKLPFCEPCREKLYHYPFPQWLKVSFAVACLVLAVSLVHGAKYFHIGRLLYRGERQIAAQHPDDAIDSLKPVVAAAPDCEKCVLLLAKAYLLNGDPVGAEAVAMKHNGGHFEKNELFDKVSQLNSGVGEFGRLMEQVNLEVQSNQFAEAHQSLAQAREAYPYWKGFEALDSQIQIGDAFNRHDWDRFLSLAQNIFRKYPESSETAAEVSSALAAKWAATGDAIYRTQAEEMLGKAQSLAVSDADKVSYREYSERIRYRIDSREIIDKPEYDRRFRAANNVRRKVSQ